MKKDIKQTVLYIDIKEILWFFGFVFILLLFIGCLIPKIITITKCDNITKDNNTLFSCNPYYDGKLYSEPRCNHLFINKTGNYCDGVLVCENEVIK